MEKTEFSLFFLATCSSLIFLLPIVLEAEDSLIPPQILNGSQTLVSSGEKFELGFFSPGNSTNLYLGICVDPRGIPQLFLHKGTEKVFRSGPWYEQQFKSDPAIAANPVFRPIFVSDADEVYYSYEIMDNVTSRFVLGQSDIRSSGKGCVAWFGDLFDIREVSKYGQDLYVRVPASEPDSYDGGSQRKKLIVLTVAVSVTSAMIILAMLASWSIINKCRRNEEKEPDSELRVGRVRSQENKLPSFQFAVIEAATNNFSLYNKIGEGGFGPVYKGCLPSGQEIAVKRLSESSGQGLQEFKNEVIFISQLQHRNLVKLQGCCIHGEEKMLVYEYMPNGSLDSLLFDETKRSTLSWQKRLDIIIGIARGLLYLHRDSRLRIIHRDVKASNILLDREMTPKISDFGMARMFGGDQTEAKTKRVVGTYGYMSPEYAIDGHFSFKSDVYSFGVLLLELLSGKKNRGFSNPDHKLNLIGHAWKLWNEGKAIELMDPLLENQFPSSEVLRCIQVVLLCVQQHPEERPTMSSVLLMLGSESVLLPQPERPGFYSERSFSETEYPSSRGRMNFSSNDTSVSLLEGR
ncbi:hypothetical protein L6164_036510 [Bauhinia variegata]|uniref:Uncharacterized protein n=1 Tax=Bauhinia variegata TaxID=167791 RepID=A0ACB9KHF2_BAUVA|nr:hypothetical protein L6164_036510 [Bauhinia variegata]